MRKKMIRSKSLNETKTHATTFICQETYRRFLVSTLLGLYVFIRPYGRQVS